MCNLALKTLKSDPCSFLGILYNSLVLNEYHYNQEGFLYFLYGMIFHQCFVIITRIMDE